MEIFFLIKENKTKDGEIGKEVKNKGWSGREGKWGGDEENFLKNEEKSENKK